MFESLSDRLGSVVSKLRNRGRLSEADVDEILGEIRTALLEADVNVGVVRSVLARSRDKAMGEALSELESRESSCYLLFETSGGQVPFSPLSSSTRAFRR
jgi:signal recognition particle GTPase